MKHTYTSSQVASPFHWQRRLPITRLLWIVVFLFFVNIKAEGQTVYSFPTIPTWIPYPDPRVPWIMTAEVIIDGVVYQITNGGNGAWGYQLTGGNGNSTSLYYSTAGDMTITIKRKDGQRFQFYDVWLKYTNSSGGYQPPWLEVTYSGSSEPNETYDGNTTTHIRNKNVSVTEVRLKYSGLLELNLDDLKVGPVATEENSAPTNITLSSNTVNENVAANTTVGTLSTTDPDAGDTFTYSFVTGSGSTDNASFSLTGNTLKINASPDYETKSSYSVRIRSTDRGGKFFEKAFAISVGNVNEAPVAVNDSYITNEDTQLTIPAPGVLTNDTDSDLPAQPLTAVLYTGPIYGTLTLNPNGSFTYTPNENFNGTDSFTYRANDGTLSSDVATVTITVNPINDAPTIIGTPATTVNQDEAYSFIPVTYDVDGNSLVFTIANKPSWATFNEATGALTGTPGNANVGTTTGIVITVSDGMASVSLPAFNLTVTTKVFVGMTLSPETFGYDGTVKRLQVAGTHTPVPIVEYENQERTIAGSQQVKATLTALGYTPLVLTAQLTVNPAILTVTADAKSKVYGDADPALTYVATGFKGSDNQQSVMTGVLGRVAGENVGNYAINQNTVSAGGNYSISYTTKNLDITPALLTVTADVKSKIYGDADPALTYVATGFKRTDTQQSTMTGALNRVAGENVGNYAINQNTVSAGGNYSISYNTKNLDITPALLTVTADAKSKVYGDADPALTYVATGFKGSDNQQSVMTGVLGRVAGENVGNYAINQNTVSAGGNYSISYNTKNLDITPAALTITADPQSKVYGTNDPSLTYQITSGKLIGTDQLTGSLARYPGENVGNYPITQGTLAASPNYNFTYQKADLAITKASLTVTADAKSKVYGTNDPSLTYQITSGKLIGTDQLTGSLARDAGENVGTYDINQGTLNASTNYDFTYQNANFDITKAGLIVTADAKSKVYGSTDPALTYQITAGKLIGTDQLTGSLARDAGENVGNYPITQGTLAASPNYNFTYQKADLAITPASLKVTADSKSKVYGTNDPSLTYQITSGKLIGTDQLTGSLARYPGENVGNYPITQGTLAASPNYNFTYQKADLAITPASLKVTADSKSKVYGTNDPSLTYQITSGKLIGSDKLTGNLSRVSGEDVGNYTINQGTLNASANYDFTYKKADFNITKASLTVTADPQSKVYGSTDPVLTYQITSGKLIGSDVLSGAIARDTGENVGSYVINQGTLTASANYDFTYQKADLAITPASLTVTADPKAKVYGTNDPSFTYQITSGKLIGTDQLTGGLARDAGENVGNYPITQGTLAASPNYNFTYQKADLAITPASLTVTADPKAKVYGTNDPSLTYQITSGKLIGTDQLTGSLARDAGENVGNYTINQGTLNASSNYDFIFNKADFDITKAGLTVTADSKSKVYGSTDPALTYQITAGKLIGTDQLTGSLARDAGENVGNYPITQGTLAASPNYNFTYQKADLAITPASLTVTADPKAKVYGTNDPSFTYQITSGKLIGTDQLTGGLARDAGENVGNYPITQGTLAASPNYNFTYQKADLAITPASLTVTADPKAKVYGTNDPSFTYQITSGKLIGTDQLTGGLARDAGENVGNYPITQGTLAASPNYNFTYQKADLAITKASLVGITFNDNSFTYDGTAKSLAITGTLPKDVGVSYVNNNQSQAGTYTVTANITGGNNYQDQTLTADLTINKATQVITWTQDLTIGCDGENTLILNATASSDLPVYYTSSNSTIAAVIGNSLTFNKQGSVDITAQQDGNNNYLPATHVIKQVNMRLIGKVKKKWEDVLIFDNSSDDFVSWQWYKDGQAIVGAQGQYYTSPTPLNGSYMVVVKDKDGNTMETCPLVIVAGQHKGGVKVVPNPARQGTTFTIKADYPSEELKGAKIMITDITGKLNKEINQVSPEVVTQVPMVPGVYIIYLFLENGKRESVKLLVN
ncbi:MBG domain-containing protein [Empedobacter sp.]|uniref:MBG domain-containing protein n=1 Tax=Empedobacter sp. TaxID=1927715 RepID=UPI002899348E|nr:MBG domain-containing protein [Empedobacter sp.]